MAEVDVFLKEEWPALGDSEILKRQLKQCRVRFLYDPYHMKTSVWKLWLVLSVVLNQSGFAPLGDI